MAERLLGHISERIGGQIPIDAQGGIIKDDASVIAFGSNFKVSFHFMVENGIR